METWKIVLNAVGWPMLYIFGVGLFQSFCKYKSDNPTVLQGKARAGDEIPMGDEPWGLLWPIWWLGWLGLSLGRWMKRSKLPKAVVIKK